MSEPITEKLSRFTPEGGKLDRDSLLYAAGRASARPNRGWIAAAGSLAATQLLTLVLLWPRPESTQPPTIVETAPASKSIPERDRQEMPDAESSGTSLWALQQRYLEEGPDAVETKPVYKEMLPGGPPLRASATSIDVILN